MTTFRASYFDGKRSAKTDVLVRFMGGRFYVSGEHVDVSYDLDDATISKRIGNSARFISFADGSKCESRENDKIDHILKTAGKDRAALFVHKLESKLKYVLLALAVTIVISIITITYAIPTLAEYVAFSLHQSTLRPLGESALSTLDDVLFSPSELNKETRDGVMGVFEGIVTEIDSTYEYGLEFRKSDKVGANAVALPSGIIVITDEMVKLAANDEELTGVLAHEVGHIENRHSLRTLLQNSIAALVIVSVTGDISSLSAGIPGLFLKLKFSRDFEREADCYAIEYLRRAEIPTKHFAHFLKRLGSKSPNSSVMSYISTHPQTSERVEMISDY
ncbi:MAG: M48 family metallopeptidase [Desulfobacterales bacterium]|nr:M48 family metallopeptidase [Desulfobacterales bacterium]